MNDMLDLIFSKLSITYGRDFTSRWEGQDMAVVKADWGNELDGFGDKPDAIVWALKNLPPDRPPTVLQFREIANRAPVKADVLRLAAPPINPELGERIRAEMTRFKTGARPSPKDWAYRIIARHDAGEDIRPISLRFAREALGILKPEGAMA
jgi:hypothetical protein